MIQINTEFTVQIFSNPQEEDEGRAFVAKTTEFRSRDTLPVPTLTVVDVRYRDRQADPV